MAVAEFGEKNMFMAQGPWKDKQWWLGIQLGPVARTHETFIGTPGHVVRA